MGHAGGQDLPALPQRCGGHAGPQVLLGVLQMVRIKRMFILIHLMALFCSFISVVTHFNTSVVFIMQGVAKSCAIETA